MMRLVWPMIRDRWHLLVGTLVAITLGVGLVHTGLAIGTTIAAAQPPVGLDPAERTAYLARLNGTNTINGIASILGIFLTVFVVRSTIDFATTERRREIALLRLAGAKRRQVRGLLLLEALLLGLAGSVLGGLLGTGLAAVQRALYVRMGIMPADVTLHWQPVHLLLDLIVGLGVALTGARTASKRATRISPLDALDHRGSDAALMSRARWINGSIATVLTVAQLATSLWMGGFLGPLLLGLGTMITGSVAASQFTPVLVPLTARAYRPSAHGPLAQLALAKLRDDARRTAQLAAPLIILVSLVAGLQGLLDTQTQAGEVELATATRADLLVRGTGDPSRRIAAVPGVASADTDTVVAATITLTQNGTTTDLPVSVVAVDPARFPDVHPYRLRSGSLAAFDEHSVVLGPGIEDLQLTRPIQKMTLTIGSHTTTVTEAARTGEGLAGNDGAYIDRRLVPNAELATGASTTWVTLNPGADPDSVRQALTDLHVGTVTTPKEGAAQRNQTKNAENRGVMAALVGVGSVYALISLLSTLAIATTQRRSEFAIDRLTGLTRAQVTRVVQLETLLVIGIGLVLGAAVTMTTLMGLWVATWRAYGTPVIAIPWPLFAGMALLTGALATVTATLAARHATNHPPVNDLTTKE